MTETWLLPDRIFDGQTLAKGRAARLRNGGVIEVINRADLPQKAQRLSLRGTLMPGFFDIQINGGGGVLFNTTPTPEGLEQIGRAHRQFGTHFWLPTVISDVPAVLEQAVSAVMATFGQFGVAGIHIEGPHISHTRRGTHNPEVIRPFDDRTLTQLERLRAADIPVLLTLAPEAVQPGQVAKLVALGVKVSIGHTNAPCAEVNDLLTEGAALFTHLFNAMSQIENRAPGAVGAAINSEAYTSIIADGLHVEPSLLAMATRARPKPDRMILVTDAMPTVGGPDNFNLYGQTVRLQSGRLVNAEGSLAGAHTTIPEEIRVMADQGVPLEQVLRMATSNPARAMALDPKIGHLIGARLETLILLQENGAVEPVNLPTPVKENAG